jgi:toxin-antitoxin system PIN domain toxin
MKLPDINVWLAGVWARHTQHDSGRRWFDEETDDLAVCRVTQMGLLRMVTNPAVTGPEVLSRRRAWEFFADLVADPRVRFLREPQNLESLWVAFSKKDDRNHKLWTDDYLAAFAQAAGAELVTFDRALAKRYPSVRIICLS